jgi:hypothetical protein
VVEVLKKNGFAAVYFPHRQDMVKFVLDFVALGMSFWIGGSAAIKQLGIPEQARDKGAEILDHDQPDLSPEEKQDVRRRELVYGLFLSSVNVITTDGCLVNVEGNGEGTGNGMQPGMLPESETIEKYEVTRIPHVNN